jgi:hypothetical protein
VFAGDKGVAQYTQTHFADCRPRRQRLAQGNVPPTRMEVVTRLESPVATPLQSVADVPRTILVTAPRIAGE